MIGRKILQHEILEQLGEGGMGVVYKTLYTRLCRNVALKFLSSPDSGTPSEKERFIREAQAASSLNHPNICTIHDVNELDGRMYHMKE